ncbi:phosphogluconate dehydrogenase C-terminal domain-containing protein [Paenibacillus koleovorans]|uniref:phosphogluconate dehydrogenase C-terminal domain-containing protein n=1 Tax=Paenibacillus koleovorans TaxID=121608 RepID=UPI000FD8BE56|nr:phosphogluconate dehydrogenase C-terminal domain-containing protein [Paenibacillus koleovorans]
MNIALIGAGGKMGGRITDNLRNSEFRLSYVEVSEKGLQRLQEKGLAATPQNEALRIADAVVLAVPDVLIGRIAADIVPQLKPGAMVIVLDPAAAHLGQLPERSDVTYFVTHPCHPPVFNDETTLEAKRDFFGGIQAKQAIVCALMQGPEADYAKGETIAVRMYGPVLRSHRITVEQMAILEPTMAETIGAAAAMFLKSAMDEAVRRGVPPEAARDFMLGHINIELAIAFGEAGNPFSDACQVAMEYGRGYWLKDGWNALFEPDSVKEQIRLMLNPGKEPAR